MTIDKCNRIKEYVNHFCIGWKIYINKTRSSLHLMVGSKCVSDKLYVGYIPAKYRVAQNNMSQRTKCNFLTINRDFSIKISGHNGERFSNLGKLSKFR